MDVPDDAPDACPVCETAYDSVSRHDAGLLVNLLDNARYRRVCFEPVSVDGTALVRFYHHTHEQVGTPRHDDSDGTPRHQDSDGTEGLVDDGAVDPPDEGLEDPVDTVSRPE